MLISECKDVLTDAVLVGCFSDSGPDDPPTGLCGQGRLLPVLEGLL